MKQGLLLSSTLGWLVQFTVNGSAVLVEEHMSLPHATTEEPFVLRQELERAVDFAGLRILENDGLDDLNLGGSYVHLSNSVLQHKNMLSLIALEQDKEGRAIFCDTKVALRSKTIHLISKLEGARIALEGMLETTDGDLVIEAMGDVTLPTLSVMGNISIVTNGNVSIPQNALVTGKVNIRAKNICMDGSLSFLDEGVLLAETIHVNSPIFTSEVGLTLMAGNSVDLYGKMGAQNLVVHTPLFTTHQGSTLIVGNEMGVTSHEVHLQGQSQLSTLMINASKLALHERVTGNQLDIRDVPHLEIMENATVDFTTIVDQPLQDEKRESERKSEYLFINRGRLRIRDNFVLSRPFQQLSTATFEGDFDVGDDLNNTGNLLVSSAITLIARSITINNSGTIKTRKILSEHDKGISSFNNKGTLDMQETSMLTARHLALSGRISAHHNLNVYPVGGDLRQSEGLLFVEGDLRLKGDSVFFSGEVKVKGNLSLELNKRLTLTRTSPGLVVGKDIKVQCGKDFGMVSQSAPIRVGGNFDAGVRTYYMLSELSGLLQQNQRLDIAKEFNLNLSSWVQSGNVNVPGRLNLDVHNSSNVQGALVAQHEIDIDMKDVTGKLEVASPTVKFRANTAALALGVRAEKSSDVKVADSFIGHLEVQAGESKIEAHKVDGQVHIDAVGTSDIRVSDSLKGTVHVRGGASTLNAHNADARVEIDAVGTSDIRVNDSLKGTVHVRAGTSALDAHTVDAHVEVDAVGTSDIRVSDSLKGTVHVRAGTSALDAHTVDAHVDIDAVGASDIRVNDSLKGTVHVRAGASTLNAHNADARVEIDAKTSKVTFGHASAATTCTGRGSGLHTVSVQSSTAAKITYEGEGSMRVKVDGEYEGVTSVNAGQEFELTHTGTKAIEGRVKAGKIIIHAKSYPVHDFSKLDAAHVHLDIPETDVDMRRDLHIESNRILELTVNNLRNHADIRGNFVANTKKDFDNRGLVKGDSVLLNIGGTFFKRKGSTVHGTHNERISADYWEVERDRVSVERVDDTFNFFGGNRTIITRVETDAFVPETLTDRHNVSHVARSGDLDVRSMDYDISGELELEGRDVRADTQRYDTNLGSTTFNFGFMGTARSERDTRPVFQSTHLKAAGGMKIKAHRTLHADGIQAQSAGGDIELSAQEVRMRTLAESYVARRWSRSGFLGFSSESGVEHDVVVAQPTLSAKSGQVKITADRFVNSGVQLDAHVVEAHVTESFDLTEAKIEIPFERKSTSWFGLSGTSVQGRQVIPLVFSAVGKEKVRLVSERGKITGAAPVITSDRLEVSAKSLELREAVAEVKIEKEEQYGPQFRFAGLDFSLAPSRFSGEEFLARPAGLMGNSSARYVDPNLRQTHLDQSGVHADALEHSPLNFLSVGIGGRHLTGSSHLQQGHGAVLNVGHLDLSKVSGAAHIAVSSLNANTTSLGAQELRLSGTTQRTDISEHAMAATIGVAVMGPSLGSNQSGQNVPSLFAGFSLAGEMAQQTALSHRIGTVNLGDVHVTNDYTHITSLGTDVRINRVSGGALSTSEESALDTKNTVQGKVTAEVGFVVTGEPISTLALSAVALTRAPIRGGGEISGSQAVNAPSTIHIATPHDNVTQQPALAFQPVHDAQNVSVDTSLWDAVVNGVAVFRDPSATNIIRILNKYASLSPLEKGRLHQDPNPIEHLLRASFETKVELPKTLYDKLKEAMGFAQAFEAKTPLYIPDSYYMNTRSSCLLDTGDEISTLLNYKPFQFNAARLSGMAYGDSDSADYESQLLRTSMKWDLKFGSQEAGGVVAEYTPESGSKVCVTAFTGTQGLGEWAGYALDYANQFLPAGVIDSRIKQGHINANFLENYQSTRWRPPTEKSEPIVFTGHSRGGAVAQIAALHVGTSFNDFNHIGTLTFGAPGVFSEDLAQYVDVNMGSRNLKFALVEDFIPHILGWSPQSVRGLGANIRASYASTGIVCNYTLGNGIFNHRMAHYIEALEHNRKYPKSC